MDFETQRKIMVESQVRPSDISDRRVIRAMEQTPRELFLPESKRFLAYADQNLSLDGNRLIMAPRLLAQLIQNLDITSSDVVLEVGAGTGYASALLSKIAQTVVALESNLTLAKMATEALTSLCIDNVLIVSGSLPAGHPDIGPYDAILISGAIDGPPLQILDQLKHGGRLIAVVKIANGMGQAIRWQRSGESFDYKVLFEADVQILPDFHKTPKFAF